MPTDLVVEAARFSLDALAARQRAGAHNLANVETPGFRAREVAFEASLRAALAAGDVGRARATHHDSVAATGTNGNNVDVTDELTGTTGLSYRLMVEVVNAELRLLRASIGGV